ncbi:hypothetical protein RRU01S_15_01030 [Agrobacterium rubi TR3 = NBRC 13261]|uniref:Uncharacterized protein n=1 Tax=Agrobacterium rubi TR3 = NBRC 13261 TaxID=1368415 RepID=A0A081CWY2_9HYPH|nr:hypothetical protein RRU01S_15_01030 [Agrobacterium rubi TR3 = NBRC 13261]
METRFKKRIRMSQSALQMTRGRWGVGREEPTRGGERGRSVSIITIAWTAQSMTRLIALPSRVEDREL